MKIYLALLLLLPLSQASNEHGRFNAFEFLKGFLEGLNEKGDINKLVHCIRNVDDIAEKIVHALELIITGDIREIFEGVRLLVESVQEYINTIIPCAKGFHQIIRLFKKLHRLEIRVIFHKIIQNADFYRDLIEKCIDAFRKNEYKLAGKYLGQFLFKLLLCNLHESPDPLKGTGNANFRHYAATAAKAPNQFTLPKAPANAFNVPKEQPGSQPQRVAGNFGNSLGNVGVAQGTGRREQSPQTAGSGLKTGAERASKGYHTQLASPLEKSTL